MRRPLAARMTSTANATTHQALRRSNTQGNDVAATAAAKGPHCTSVEARKEQQPISRCLRAT